MALNFGHLQSYQARGCSEWEELCSRKSSPALALLMSNMGLWEALQMALLNQVSCSLDWQAQSGAETLPLG